MNLKEFEDMWSTNVQDYVLVRSQMYPGKYAIYNRSNRTIVLVDDDAAYEAVVANMLEQGVPIMDGPPAD